MDDALGEESRAVELDDWEQLDLPWIAMWLKELITWGTLDPVATMLLAKRRLVTRQEAQVAASEYYALQDVERQPNATLDPRQVRDWMDEEYPRRTEPRREGLPATIDVYLEPIFSQPGQFRVIPVENEGGLAGTILLVCSWRGRRGPQAGRPTLWNSTGSLCLRRME